MSTSEIDIFWWDVLSSQAEVSFSSHLFPFISLLFFSRSSLVKFQQRRWVSSGTYRLFSPSFLIRNCTFFTTAVNLFLQLTPTESPWLCRPCRCPKRKHQSFSLLSIRRAFNALENWRGLVFRQKAVGRHLADRWLCRSSGAMQCDGQGEVDEFSRVAEFSAVREWAFPVFRRENVSTSFRVMSIN